MATFLRWVRDVLDRGESKQEELPAISPDEWTAVVRAMREAFERRVLDLAGAQLQFDADVGIWAAMTVARGCWRTAGGDGPAPLELGPEPASPSAHLSADTILRLLPAIHRRARSRGPDEPLVAELEAIARRWPLSGVLLDLAGPPTTLPDFSGHSGLQLLYAERFVENPRWEWLPPVGPGREWVERICIERGRPVPAPPGEAASV